MEQTTVSERLLDTIKNLGWEKAGIMYPSSDYFRDSNTTGNTSENRQNAFIEIIERINSISKEDDEDDFIFQPSPYVLDYVSTVMKTAYTLASGKIVKPVIAADGKGGLKFDWRNSSKEVRIFVPHNDSRLPYLYFRHRGEDGIIKIFNAQALASFLTWLSE